MRNFISTLDYGCYKSYMHYKSIMCMLSLSDCQIPRLLLNNISDGLKNHSGRKAIIII